MIGKLVRQLNESVQGYFSSIEDSSQFPAAVWFEPNVFNGSLRKRDTGRLVRNEAMAKVRGETKSLGRDRIAFILPFIRLGGNYLAGEGLTLNLEIDLPDGKVEMQVVGVSYEQIGKHCSTARYLIEAKILHMGHEDRKAYDRYICRDKAIDRAKSGAFAFELPKN